MILNDEDDDNYLVDTLKDEEEAESYLEKEMKKNAVKELKHVDHATQEYNKFKKNLYF